MQGRHLGWLLGLVGLVGCGNSSSSDLFHSRGLGLVCSSGTVEACALPGGCPAHRTCRADGREFGPCTCDSSGTGGAPINLGTGGETLATGGFGPTPLTDSGAGGYGVGGSGGAGGTVAVACPAGSFTGTAVGSNYKSSTGLPIDVKAELAFTLTETGAITGTYTGTSPGRSSADLSGTLDCSTLTATINVENGAYPGSLFPPTAGGTFSGTLTGDYSPDAASFSGQWTIQEGNPAYGGQGTWTAN